VAPGTTGRRRLRGYEVWEMDNLVSTFFAIFYVDDAYLASRDTEILQRALDILVSLFERVGGDEHVQDADNADLHPG
jgi:hypothetical protein